MDLRSLRNFVAVVDAGSLTRAAASLDIAQPALTAQIKRLESEFEVTLLERSSSGVRPTSAGMRLYQDASALIAAADAMQTRVLQQVGMVEGEVSIIVPNTLCPTVMTQVLVQVRKRFPRLRLRVIGDLTEVALSLVQEGRVDIGILADPPESARLQWRPLAVEPFMLVGIDPQGLIGPMLQWPSGFDLDAISSRYPAIRFTDAVTLPLLMYSPRRTMRRHLDELCASLGCTLNIAHEQDDYLVAQGLLFAGEGFALTTTSSLITLPPGPFLVQARLVEPALRRTLGLAWLPGRSLSPAVRAVIQLVREEFAVAIRSRCWVAEHVDRDDYQID